MKTQVIDIAGELIVEKGFRIVAGNFDQAQVRQGNHDRRFSGVFKLASGIAEMVEIQCG